MKSILDYVDIVVDLHDDRSESRYSSGEDSEVEDSEELSRLDTLVGGGE